MRIRPQAAFTLIEVMIVVIIVGILAAIAIPTFSRFILRARTSEATSFLQEIRAREETYRADNGQYAATPANPSSVPRGSIGTFDATSGAWVQLGARPGTQGTRFQYQVTAGGPGSGVGDIPNFAQNDFWYMGRAVGDLDGDGNQVTFETYSPSTHIWCNEAKGFE